MADTDLIVLDDAREAAFSLDKKYRRAVRDGDIDAVMELKPHVEGAYDKLSSARLKLLESGVITTEADVTEMRMVKAEIDEAAATQQIVVGAAKLIAKLATFV